MNRKLVHSIVIVLLVVIMASVFYYSTLPTPFSIQVIPQKMEALAGQRCILLVSVVDKGNWLQQGFGQSVDISAIGPGRMVTVS